MIHQAVILAAGRGTRLGLLTKDRPKSMLPVLGKPIVVRVMDRLRNAGVRRFVVVIGENDGAVAAYLNRSWYPDTEVKYAVQKVPTGTVDALLLAAPFIDGPFLLTSVDNLTSDTHLQNLITCFNQHSDHVAALSLVSASPDQIRKSSDVVIEDDRIIAIEEKPEHPRGSWASFMLYAFSQKLLHYLPQVRVSSRGEKELVSAIQASIQAGGRVGYTVADWRMHLTREIDLLAINKYFLQEARDAHILSEIHSSVHIIPPVRIDPKVSVGQNTHIGPNVYLESDVVIGQGASLRDSVILNGAVIAAREQCWGQIVANGVRVSETPQA